MGNLLDAGLDKFVGEQWPYVMDGTHGVCLKEISAKNVIIKAIGVAELV